MASLSKALSGLDPLKDLLGDVLARLEILESKVGVAPTASATVINKAPAVVSKASTTVAGEVPAVKAYDKYMKECLGPLISTCDDLGGLGDMGNLLKEAWEGVRTVIVLASRSKMPDEDIAQALTPHLQQTQRAVQAIRDLKLGRDWERHHKAIIEMLACLSWVLLRAPKTLPVGMVKETQGSAEFWTNRIRKDYKGKDDKQVEFCDNIKKTISGLAEYIEEYHKTGLTFNPRGVSLAEAAIRLSDEDKEEPTDLLKSPVQKRKSVALGAAAGTNLAGLMGELSKRKTAEGDSAATGLRKVSKEQQTWRKEFKGAEVPAPPPLVPPPALKKEEAKKKQLKGLPIFEYQDRGFKWVIENHTKESISKEFTSDGLIKIDITDPKQQVYLYNCDDVKVQITGKFKSLILDKCTNCAVVYDTLISSAEVVNSQKIQLQVTGVCPVFTIDKTNKILIWLSQESLSVSKFTTSLSSEMNISFPDGEDMKEVPIPEQFVHNLTNGSVQSEVSDLYH